MNTINVILFPYLNTIFFPHAYIPLDIEDPNIIALIKTSIIHSIPLAIIQDHSHSQSPCSLATPVIVRNNPNGGVQILLIGTGKGIITEIVQKSPFYMAKSQLCYDTDMINFDLKHPDIQEIKNILENWISSQISDPHHIKVILSKIITVNHILDYACMFLLQDRSIKKILLAENSFEERVELLKRLILPKNKNSGHYFAYMLENFENLEYVDAICQYQ